MFNKFILLLLVFIVSISCVSQENIGFRENIVIKNNVFEVSYNEVFEQPNWIKYEVRNIFKMVDRGSLDFYTEESVHTSDDDDYYKNQWDKGHLAPAASFSDNYANLYQTFSFLNCSLQIDELNRGEWAQLESQVRNWASETGTIKVFVELIFNENHQVLESGAHVPSAFKKHLTFFDGSKKCFYFINEAPNKNWDKYIIDCQT